MNSMHTSFGLRTRATSDALTSRSRQRPLTLCLSAALATQIAASNAAALHAAKDVPPNSVVPMLPVHAPAQIWTVQNCDDSGTDSLRDIIENPMKAQSGDKVDLSHLPPSCGMADSTITLGSEIVVAQDDLIIYGPAERAVTISGDGKGRVFHHTGMGTLSLSALKVADGYYHIAGNAYGGCIESDSGSVVLTHIVVDGCTVVSDNGVGNGGGVSSYLGTVTLIASTVSGNQASGGKSGWGGGIYSNGITVAWYSSISGNTAQDGPAYAGFGGGVATQSGATFIASTVDNNTGGDGGGLATHGSVTILDSTLSTNTATRQGGGLYAPTYYSVSVANSTIAFNRCTNASGEGGVFFWGGLPTSLLTLQSSIIAKNTAGAADIASDIYFVPGSLGGGDNLVIAANVFNPVVITETADPQLGPLQFNGGPTRTHQLSLSSPALGKGNLDGLPASITADQRGLGYPRTTGASVDLGALQFDTIFADGFDSPF
jgi:hypothetical protein